MRILALALSLAVCTGVQGASPVVVQQGTDCRLSETFQWTHDDSIPVDGFTVWAVREVTAASSERSVPLDWLNLSPGTYKIYILSRRDRTPSVTSGGPVLVQVDEPAGGFCTP